MTSKMIRERSQRQLENDKRLSEFFKNYHAKIKEVNKKAIFEKVEKPRKSKKEKIKKKLMYYPPLTQSHNDYHLPNTHDIFWFFFVNPLLKQFWAYLII